MQEYGIDEIKNMSIAYFAEIKQDWLKTFLRLPNGIPSHDTIQRVMSMVDSTILYCKGCNNVELQPLLRVQKPEFQIYPKPNDVLLEWLSFGGKEYSPKEAAEFIRLNAEELSYIPGKVKLYSPLPVTLDDLISLYKSNGLVSVSVEASISEIPRKPCRGFMMS